ncbi:NADH dehydrogenase subunit N [Arcticibacter tournemirensis]|uniref:NADH-quinone oxidoreductase subunit N n=1 Tax=Arcticibacter tournemirensis TaxID=699437 RepID=A0A5M9H5Z3_9SPHI|nr:NADH-quinone oxidoreductase subunit N [Arcticibacter tournemirensis]KAA8481659.1 NADH-quinone oxidoreductase subunit N [Arcticibacter tournemirensis]TQM48943.1 NADH dehydrogenase subunit N [Arcticibacter tournemirensis]
MNALITISLLAILILYLGLFKAKRALLPVTLLGLTGAFVLTVIEWNSYAQPIFNNMMQFDRFAVVFSGITILTTVLVLILSKDYFERISANVAEYYALILFSLAGIIIMVSYHNLSMLFIGIEIMSVSLYILAGIKKRDFSSNEAALKYFLMGAFSTGFLLFGTALIYGATGSFDLAEIREYLVSSTKSSPLLYSGIILLIVGLCFKVGAAPFHFWTPDVYEGSPSLITAYMSTVVKTAGFAAFLRIMLYCFAPKQEFWIPMIVAIAALSLLIGNVTAVYQQHFKRMLAYSSISHAGYMLFGLIALNASSVNALFVYAAAYSVASVIAFAALILLQRQTGNDSFDSFNGIARKNPFLAFTLTIAMLSLAGIPLTAGFVGKFMMFSRTLSAYHTILVVFAVINAVIGIFYYFRVIISMYFKPEERAELTVPTGFKIVLAFSALATVVLGIYPEFIASLI